MTCFAAFSTKPLKAKAGNEGNDGESWEERRPGGKKGGMSKHGKRGGTGDGWHSPFVFSRVHRIITIYRNIDQLHPLSFPDNPKSPF